MSVSASAKGIIASSEAESGVVTLSGNLLGWTATGVTSATVGIRINTDGTVDQNINGVYTQVSSSTDWIDPNSAARSLHQVFCETTSGSDADGGDAIDTWHNMTTEREFTLTVGASEIDTGTWNIIMRFNGGADLDNGSYIMTADTT